MLNHRHPAQFERVAPRMFVPLLLLALGCGSSTAPEPPGYDARLQLSADCTEFAELMSWYEAAFQNKSSGYRANRMAEFQEHLTVPEHRQSERFLAAAEKIFALEKVNTMQFSPKIAEGIVLLARREGHPEAREWVEGFSTQAFLGKINVLSRLGSYAYRVPAREAPSAELIERVEPLIDELESFGQPFDDQTTREFVTYSLRGRFPRLLEHLRAGMPPKGEAFGPASNRTGAAEHPQVLWGAVRVFDGLFSKSGECQVEWAKFVPWLDVVRECTSGRAAAAELIALARHGVERDLEFVIERARTIPDSTHAAAMAWAEKATKSRYLPNVKLLLALKAGDTPDGRATIAQWVTDHVTEDGRDQGESLGGGVQKDPRLALARRLLGAIGGDGQAVVRSGLEPAASWPLELLAVETLGPTEPELVAKRLNAHLDGSGYQRFPAAGPRDRVLTAARQVLAKAPRNPEIDGFLLRLLSHPRSADRSAVVTLCRERLGERGLVDAVFQLMSTKSEYSQEEYAIFVETLGSVQGVEAHVLSNLERELDAKGRPEDILWILKVLALDLLDQHSSKAALPVLERMAGDTGSYRSLDMTRSTGSSEAKVARTETIRFADRVASLVRRLDGR